MAGKPAGAWGIGCFSLYATKNVTTGEGGIITTSDAAVADRLRLMRNQGMRKKYEYVLAGLNLRLTDVQAAIGIPQMERIAEVTNRRRDNAAALTHQLARLSGARLPFEPAGRDHVYHQYTIELNADLTTRRDELVAEMVRCGVGAAVYYPRLIGDYAYLADHAQLTHDPTPRARQAAAGVISLPIHPGLEPGDISRVAEVAAEVIDG